MKTISCEGSQCLTDFLLSVLYFRLSVICLRHSLRAYLGSTGSCARCSPSDVNSSVSGLCPSCPTWMDSAPTCRGGHHTHNQGTYHRCAFVDAIIWHDINIKGRNSTRHDLQMDIIHHNQGMYYLWVPVDELHASTPRDGVMGCTPGD